MLETHRYAENVVREPRSFVDDVFDRNFQSSKFFAKVGNSSWPVTHGHSESHQTPVCGKTAFKTAPKNGCVYVTATERQDDPKNKMHFKLFFIDWRN